MTTIQDRYVDDLMIDQARELNNKIASDCVLLFEARSVKVLIHHLKALIDDLSEDRDIETVVSQYKTDIQVSTTEISRNRKKSVGWLRKYLSVIRSEKFHFGKDLRIKIEDAYRYVSRTKKRIRVNSKSSKYVLVRENEYWTGGFVVACWWKFREVCREVAETGHFHLLEDVAECEIVKEPAIYEKRQVMPKRKVLYLGMRGVEGRLKCDGRNFIKIFVVPAKHFDENCNVVPHQKLIIIRGSIKEFILPKFLNNVLPQGTDEINDLLQTHPGACFMALEGLLDTYHCNRKVIEIPKDTTDIDTLEDESKIVWGSAERGRGKVQKGNEFIVFRNDVLDKVKTLIYFISRETTRFRQLKGNERVSYLKDRARRIAYQQLKEYIEGHPPKKWPKIRYVDAIEHANKEVELKQLPKDAVDAFSDNLWLEEVKKVAGEIGWKPKGGRPKKL